MATAHYVSVFILMLSEWSSGFFRKPVVPALLAETQRLVDAFYFILLYYPSGAGVLSLYFGQKEWSFIFINMPISAVKQSAAKQPERRS
jgi:cytochrome b561